MPMPRMIWFDFGGVLSPPIPALFQQYEHKTGLSPGVLQQAMLDVATEMGMPMLAPIENAIISEEEWGACLEEALRRRHPHIDLSRARLRHFGEQWFDGVAANAAMVSALCQLKSAGFRIGILTNNVVEWEPHWRAMLGLDKVVDLIVDSCKEGCRKPDPAFFNIASQRGGLASVEYLLIDDLAENIATARHLGWQGIHFQDNDDALRQLERITGHMLYTHREAQPA